MHEQRMNLVDLIVSCIGFVLYTYLFIEPGAKDLYHTFLGFMLMFVFFFAGIVITIVATNDKFDEEQDEDD